MAERFLEGRTDRLLDVAREDQVREVVLDKMIILASSTEVIRVACRELLLALRAVYLVGEGLSLPDEPELPAAVAEVASSAAGQAQSTSAAIGEIVADIFPADVVIDDSMESILNEAIDRIVIVDQTFAVLVEQFDVRRRLEGIVRPSQFLNVVPVPGSDLRDLARKHYGDADFWPRIAKQNGLETSEIPDGLDVIVIPLSLPNATDDRVGC